MSVFELTNEFNKKVIGIERNETTELGESEFSWLLGALREEIGELDSAYKANDFVEQVDALIDLIYFAAGAFTRLGIEPETAMSIFKIVHECNMQKVKGRKEGREVESELDATKPEDWTDPSMAIIDILNEAKGLNK